MALLCTHSRSVFISRNNRVFFYFQAVMASSLSYYAKPWFVDSMLSNRIPGTIIRERKNELFFWSQKWLTEHRYIQT